MITVAVYRFPHSRRSCFCAEAMSNGIRAVGDRVIERTMPEFREADTDVAVFYGFNKPLLDAYKAAGKKAIYVDLGYWRREGQFGHHKLGINSRHPTSYFQRRKHDDRRWRSLNIGIAPWQTKARTPKAPIIVVGMSGKGAAAEGYLPQQWEAETIARLRKITDRPIIYRPKPNWRGSSPISGAEYQVGDNQGRDVPAVLSGGIHAIVSHHSNVGVDALLAGVPVFCVEGITTPLSRTDLSKIEDPLFPDGREQWAWDAAYTQWTVPEMSAGHPWRHLKNEGLV